MHMAVEVWADIYINCVFLYIREEAMKTLVDISEDVLDEAMRLSDAKTKREVINMALDELIKARLRQRLR